jgi:hypothetical protein
MKQTNIFTVTATISTGDTSFTNTKYTNTTIVTTLPTLTLPLLAATTVSTTYSNSANIITILCSSQFTVLSTLKPEIKQGRKLIVRKFP